MIVIISFLYQTYNFSLMNDECLNEKAESNFPIPRESNIQNPCSPMQPDYKPNIETFNTDLFQHFYSMANYHIPQYDLVKCQIHYRGIVFSPALEVVAESLDTSSSDNYLCQHIIRKYLIELHYQLISLTNNPQLFSIATLHNELKLANDYFIEHKLSGPLFQYCSMLLAETFDLYGSTVESHIYSSYWSDNLHADKLISDFLQPEIEKLRCFDPCTLEILESCMISRAKERAPQEEIAAINQWSRTILQK